MKLDRLGKDDFEKFIRNDRPDCELHLRTNGDYVDYETAELSEAWAAGWKAATRAANRKHRELEDSLDLIHRADMRAIKRWQAATGRDMTWPDRTEMIVWLLEQLPEAQG